MKNTQLETKLNKQELQYCIRNKTNADTLLADKWLRDNGVNAQTVAHTHEKLIQAQKMAHELLTTYLEMLTPSQIKILKEFQRKINTGHIRKKLKPQAANSVLNIKTKIVRTLYKQQQQA